VCAGREKELEGYVLWLRGVIDEPVGLVVVADAGTEFSCCFFWWLSVLGGRRTGGGRRCTEGFEVFKLVFKGHWAFGDAGGLREVLSLGEVGGEGSNGASGRREGQLAWRKRRLLVCVL
jgi:hypothetical protein